MRLSRNPSRKVERLGITHWDEVKREAGTWSNLGAAAGAYRCGVRRIELAPGETPPPARVHGESEVISYVVAGSGLAWMDGKVYEIRAGDCIVHMNSHEAHTIRGGEEGLDLVAFGPRELDCLSGEPELVWPEPQSERPPAIVAAADVEASVRGGRIRRDLGRAAGSRLTGLKQVEMRPGVLSGPPHVHSAEEEIFVVLEGDGTLELTATLFRGGGREEHPVRAGSIVTRPPGTGVAHTFRAGDRGLTLLAWGTRDPNDMCWYPRSKKLLWGGVGVIGRIQELDYWEGEELE